MNHLIKKTNLRILILSFYYSPDLSAGSFRAAALVLALRKKLPRGAEIEVITTVPNRYRSFVMGAPAAESDDGFSIRRIVLPPHRGGMLDQSRAFLTYWRQVMSYVVGRDYDLVIGTSSRLMTAVLAARVAQKKNSLLYLDIRDIFVDTISDVLPRRVVPIVKPVFKSLEKWAINRSNKVNLVSEGFAEYFKTRYPYQKYSYFTNGIDVEFAVNQVDSSRDRRVREGLTIVYAGNLGAGQGLEFILPDIAKKMTGQAVFRVIGDGGRKELLRSKLAAAAVSNVVLLDPVNRNKLIEEYENADVLFLHLNDYEAFKKVLPSKIFEYAATGKPIWAGVSGYASVFIKREVSNSAVFQPCDATSALDAFKRLVIQQTARQNFINKFSRDTIMDAMALDILEVLTRSAHNPE